MLNYLVYSLFLLSLMMRLTQNPNDSSKKINNYFKSGVKY